MCIRDRTLTVQYYKNTSLQRILGCWKNPTIKRGTRRRSDHTIAPGSNWQRRCLQLLFPESKMQPCSYVLLHFFDCISLNDPESNNNFSFIALSVCLSSRNILKLTICDVKTLYFYCLGNYLFAKYLKINYLWCKNFVFLLPRELSLREIS